MTPREKKLVIQFKEQNNLDYQSIAYKLNLDPYLVQMYYKRHNNLKQFSKPANQRQLKLGGIFGSKILRIKLDKPYLSPRELLAVIHREMDLQISDQILFNFLKQQNL